jgi:hypothetical protein
MGIFSDTYDEFKKATPQEKIFIVGGVVGVIAIALYIHNKGGATPNPNLQGGAATPGPSGGGNPFTNLPYGTTVGTDANGNPVYTIQPPPPGTTPTTPTTGTNPLIPFGQYTGPSYSNLKPNTFYTYNNTKYKLFTGGGGRLYGTNPSGQNVLLYAPKSGYTNVPQGGGPYGTRVLGMHHSRLAPGVEGKKQYTHATKIYSLRNR